MNEELDNLKKAIEEILIDTFNVIDSIYNSQCEGGKFDHNTKPQSRLIFPQTGEGKYQNGSANAKREIRVSEQELRFIFVEQFIKYCESHKDFTYYYAVETPTDYRYVFSGSDETPKVAKLDSESTERQEGISGNFDVTVHDNNGKRVCWIEFKALNPERDDFSKDFLKLKTEAEPKDGRSGFFVHLLKSANNGTIKSLIEGDKEKQQDPKLIKLMEEDLTGIEYYCHVLPPKGKRKSEYSGQTFKSWAELKDVWDKKLNK